MSPKKRKSNRKDCKTPYKQKRTPSRAEIDNDPSLQFFPLYRRGELVVSDNHNECVRFWSYEAENKVRLASLNGITPIDEMFDVLSIRRPCSR